MMPIADIFIVCLALGVSAPMLLFVLECAAALIRSHEIRSHHQVSRPALAVLIPAHDEEKNIAATVETILSQMHEGDRIVVVADNCNDRTAELARQAGAAVVERRDPSRRGKGYALDFGIHALEASPPEMLIVVDGDCSVQPGSLDALADAVSKTGRPAQAIYLMEPPAKAQPRDYVSAFAFLVKNYVRPLGCSSLAWPGLLTGSGMAFPWDVIHRASLADGNIVEDMQLGLTLALSGFAPQLCTAARITSRLPEHDAAAASQRKRWEHGHLQTLLHWVPKLIVQACIQRRFELLALAMQLCVPPLALLVLLWTAAISVALLGKLLFALAWLPVIVLACTGGLMFIVIVGIWHRFARSIVPAKSLLSIPFYVTWKLPLYASFLFRRQKAWVRTAR